MSTIKLFVQKSAIISIFLIHVHVHDLLLTDIKFCMLYYWTLVCNTPALGIYSCEIKQSTKVDMSN